MENSSLHNSIYNYFYDFKKNVIIIFIVNFLFITSNLCMCTTVYNGCTGFLAFWSQPKSHHNHNHSKGFSQWCQSPFQYF